MKSTACYLLFPVLLLMAGCGFPRLNKEAPEINEVSPDTKFTIVLPEDHTTGYTWQLRQDYDKSVVSQVNEVWHGNAKGIYFNLHALSAGQTTLSFVSRKYTDTADTRHFIVKINGN
jgi:predicted secreted protein